MSSSVPPQSPSPTADLPSPAPDAQTEGLPEEFILTPELVEEEAIRGDIVLRGAVVLLAVLLGWTHLADTVQLVQIRTGQELAAHGLLPPRTDAFFSYTASDRPWANLAWLGDLLLAGLYAIGGGALLSAFCGVVCGVLFWILGRTSQPGAPTWWSSVCAALAVVALFPLLTPGPTVITVAGLALTLAVLHRGREAQQAPVLWALVPLLWVWSNADPHAYLGWIGLILFAVGRLIFRRQSESVRPWLLPVGCAIVAAFLHPLALEVLRSPVVQLRQLNPLMLSHGGWTAQRYPYLWQPVFEGDHWRAPGWHLGAALLVAVLACITLVLNRRRADRGLATAWLGLNALGLASGIDFTALAVLNAVVAGLNGQQWYLATCRQEYTLDNRELLFSRAGRAVTVLGLFVVAYWGLSGRMMGADGRRVGFGFSHQLQGLVDGYHDLLGELKTDELDDHPLHITPQQGDLLIWLGRRSFTDSRLLPFVSGEGPNLFDVQRRITQSLRTPEQPLTTGEEIAAWAKVWQTELDAYGVTHVVVPLQTPAGYALWINLVSQGMQLDSGEIVRFWQQVGIAGPATTLYRLDSGPSSETEALSRFLEGKRYATIIQQTFRQPEDGQPVRRGLFPRGPTFYETSLLFPEPLIPNESLVARHYATRLVTGERSLFEIVAYCHQIIRHARRGLEVNPNSAESYLLLGEAYQRLWEAESSVASHRLGVDAADRRFHEAVAAYHHALVCRPDDPQPHFMLFPLYLRHGDLDLALRSLDRIEELTGSFTLTPRSSPDYSQRQQDAKRQRAELDAWVTESRAMVDEALAGGLENGVRAALMRQCPGLALELIEKDLTLMAGSMELSRQYAALLLLVGRTSDAFDQAEQQLRSLEGFPEAAAALQALRIVTAYANLAADEYERAMTLWSEFGQQSLRTALDSYTVSLPMTTLPGEQADPWPLFQIMSAAESLGRWIPEWQLTQWQQAMCELEDGRNAAAARLLEEVLQSDPQSLLRPQISMYLTMLTGQSVEPFLPASSEPAEGPPAATQPAGTGAGPARFTPPEGQPRPSDRPPSPALPEPSAVPQSR